MTEQHELETAIENIGNAMRRAYEEGLTSVMISLGRPVIQVPDDGLYIRYVAGPEMTVKVSMRIGTEPVPWA